MLTGFMFALRRQGLKVGPQEWLALMRAIGMGLHESRFTGFYNVARSLLCRTEADFDAYDQVFANHFQGVALKARELSEEILGWLRQAAGYLNISPEELAAMEKLGLDELMRQLEERMREQDGEHHGGNRWIGTGGTSPFGWGGAHPTGIRIGGQSMGRSAMQVAELRRFRGYRTDLQLDVRQIKVALARLRELTREGTREELDVEESIEATCKNAGELTLVWRAPRRNNVRLVLLMDVGGSMDPHSRLVSRLFSAAHSSRHFKAFEAYYFHNCVYDDVYHDAGFWKGLPLTDLFAKHGPETKLVMVGDALMHPVELFQPNGAITWTQHNFRPGIECLRRLSDHFTRVAWLNPEPDRYWRHPTVNAIRDLFPMFPLTLDGLNGAVSSLVKGPVRARI
ncbi:MAG: VWA domain-containing protein [Polyangia bacterium]|nr:VWA domain-containing protein [Polyangia bacterium]